MSRYVYPRLPGPIAMMRLEEIKEAFSLGGLAALETLVSMEHPRASPVSTGGRAVKPDHIAWVRAGVLKAIDSWRAKGSAVSDEAAFDLALGRAIHERLEILPADAAHEETWSFLTLIVFPDIAVLRFPGMHIDRLIGTQRNVLRRPWSRQEALGDLLYSTDHPLGEDELTGLFERTALARNRVLIRKLAATVLQYEGPVARSEWARAFYKRVTFHTGPRLLDALSENELDELIGGALEGYSADRGPGWPDSGQD